MHELAIATSVVDAVCARAGDRRVHVVTLRIGALTAVVPDALRFSFELAAEGTVASAARLAIEETAGADLQIVSMEVSSCAEPAGAPPITP